VALLPHDIRGQSAADRVGGWYAVEAAWKPAGSRLGLEWDVQLRDFQIVGDFAQTSLRAGLTVRSHARPLSLTVGTAWFLNGTPGESDVTRSERRVYQTLNYTQSISERVRFKHRARAEQRWFEEDVFRSRYRYRLEADMALGRAGFADRGVWLVASNEVLLNGETSAGGRAFDRLDQNRAYLALNLPAIDRTRFEVGYLNVYRSREVRHRVRLTLEWAIP
jgi:hypothetical protein